MNIEYLKIYGICDGFYKGKKVFFTVIDGKKTSLHYNNAVFALKKAENYIKFLYKDFIDFQGNNVKFIFKMEVK